MKIKYLTKLFFSIIFLSISFPVFADTENNSFTIPKDSNIDAPEVNDLEDSDEDVADNDDKTDYYEDDIEDSSEETEQGIINPFDIKITFGTQNPLNKKIPVWIAVTPNIDAERAEITWDSRYGLTFIPQYEQFVKLNKGETYSFKTILVPEEPGSYTLTVNVNEWGYGRNYTSSSDIQLKISENLVTDPATEGYGIATIVMYIVLALIAVAVIFLLIFAGKKFATWMKEWLKPPEF